VNSGSLFSNFKKNVGFCSLTNTRWLSAVYSQKKKPGGVIIITIIKKEQQKCYAIFKSFLFVFNLFGSFIGLNGSVKLHNGFVEYRTQRKSALLKFPSIPHHNQPTTQSSV
jgi:hypothetical protein